MLNVSALLHIIDEGIEESANTQTKLWKDISKWVGDHARILLGIIGIAILAFLVTTLFLSFAIGIGVIVAFTLAVHFRDRLESVFMETGGVLDYPLMGIAYGFVGLLWLAAGIGYAVLCGIVVPVLGMKAVWDFLVGLYFVIEELGDRGQEALEEILDETDPGIIAAGMAITFAIVAGIFYVLGILHHGNLQDPRL